jgi:acyl carrier protein
MPAMDEIATRLTTCFQIVFPELPVSEIPAVRQDSVAAWDSVAAITLMNVIEEEFGVAVDFDQLAELDSFERLHDHLRHQIPAA